MVKKSKWLAALAVLFVGQAALQQGFLYPKWRTDYAPKSQGVVSGLDPTQILAAMAGFRELVAGILWVRADSFFDTGNYDAVLPIIRLVTWLDPHQIDVYATGMWHIGYNFTDEDSRSDRRYLPSAVALGREGAKMNPDTYELFFETGWIWYHKIDDQYDKAVKWFEDANERKDMLPARRNLLSNAYQRNGQVEDALNLYYKLYNEAEKTFKDVPIFQNRQNVDTIENNLDTLLVRMIQRGYLANKRNDGSAQRDPYDINPPFDVGFSVRATVEDAKVIRFEGTWNVLPVGTRIRVVLKDAEFPNAIPGGADWDRGESVRLDPEPGQTFMQDQLYVRNRRFNRKIDMSRDPTMYPFVSKDYILEFYYNPRSAPPHIQDKFGFNGEGMTDKNFANKEVRPGSNVLYASFKISRDQLLRRGDWYDKVPVFQTPNFRSVNITDQNMEDLIDVPNIRAAQPNAPAGN